MAERGRSDARLVPSDPPSNCPPELEELRGDALEKVASYRAAKGVMQRRRNEAVQALDRYEAALLEHQGQMTLFEEGSSDGTDEAHLG